VPRRRFECSECGHEWGIPHGSPSPLSCPECESRSVRRVRENRHRDNDRRPRRGGVRELPASGDSDSEGAG
jgi:hypothetical protein